jgi:outer membrane protein OmpA-like peptidoglycan-associated protein
MSVELTPPNAPPTPKPAAPPPPAQAQADPCATLNKQLEASLVHFDLDRSSISDSAAGEVEAVSAAIKSSGVGSAGEFSLEGHCDATGSDGYNVSLSERRAKSVLDRLVTLGVVNASHAKTIGLGKQQPLDPADTPEAYAKNRRVAVVYHCPAK